MTENKLFHGSFSAHMLRNEQYPFHMPGHKRNKDFIPAPMGNLDQTEIDGMDELANPRGIIKDLEKKISEKFSQGKRDALISVNGSTGLIVSALLQIPEKSEIIAVRNGHKSMFTGIYLNDLEPRYIQPVYDIFPQAVSVSQIKTAIKKYPQAKAIFITSPTYEGITADVEKIYDLAKKNNMYLIIDAAHGAHFPFSSAFPISPIPYGDIVIMSLHKTLPFMNQLSIAFVSNRIPIDRFRMFTNMIQTSSPSYVLLSQLDDGLDRMKQADMDSFVDHLKKFRSNMDPKILWIPDSSAFATDISKLIFLTGDSQRLAVEMKKNRIALEFIRENYALGITTLADTQEALQYLEKIIKEIFSSNSMLYRSDRFQKSKSMEIFSQLPKKHLSIRKAMNQKTREIDLEDAPGSIVSDFLTPYPPGIPLLVPGEEITKDHVEFLQGENKRQSIHGFIQTGKSTKISIVI